MLNHQKIQRNLFAVENALAQQRLEGLEIPLDVVEDMKRAARGEITIKEGISNTLRKFSHEQIRGERPLPR
ncbi:MAG: antitoxin VbhA family protein [Magnetococcales bacterium]|nr:antitoxin VbhA family protein [Magnetococcales bacterium]MBF0116864.1 antitoxin VbhA family protein [Magnetococcales bacterium]